MRKSQFFFGKILEDSSEMEFLQFHKECLEEIIKNTWTNSCENTSRVPELLKKFLKESLGVFLSKSLNELLDKYLEEYLKLFQKESMSPWRSSPGIPGTVFEESPGITPDKIVKKLLESVHGFF